MTAPLKPTASLEYGGPARCLGIEFNIEGREKQILELRIDSGTTVFAQSAAVLEQDTDIQRTNSFGYGKKRGLASTMMAAVNRMIGGENLLLTRLTNTGVDPAVVELRGPNSGDLVAIDLDSLGGEIFCQQGHFFAGVLGVRAGWGLNWNIPSILFGNLPFLFQRVSAPTNGYRGLEDETHKDGHAQPSRAWVFLHAPGDVKVKELKPGDEPMKVTPGALLAMSPHILRGAAWTHDDLKSKVINLLKPRPEEPFNILLRPPSAEVCELKGPCRVWTTTGNAFNY